MQLITSYEAIKVDGNKNPEFDSWNWVDYWQPLSEVIYFKRNVYEMALKELSPIMKKACATKSHTSHLPSGPAVVYYRN